MFFEDDLERIEELQDGAKEALRSNAGAKKKCPRCGGTDIINGICKSPMKVSDGNGGVKEVLCFANLN